MPSSECTGLTIFTLYFTSLTLLKNAPPPCCRRDRWPLDSEVGADWPVAGDLAELPENRAVKLAAADGGGYARGPVILVLHGGSDAGLDAVEAAVPHIQSALPLSCL